MTDTENASIGALLDRYLIGLDEDRLDDDWIRSLFTPDACVEFPHKTHEGIDGMADFHRSALAAFAATQHLGSSVLVERTGDRATLKANLITTHLHKPDNVPTVGPMFTSGTAAVGEARLTEAGWRLQRLTIRSIWRTGNPPPRG